MPTKIQEILVTGVVGPKPFPVRVLLVVLLVGISLVVASATGVGIVINQTAQATEDPLRRMENDFSANITNELQVALVSESGFPKVRIRFGNRWFDNVEVSSIEYSGIPNEADCHGGQSSWGSSDYFKTTGIPMSFYCTLPSVKPSDVCVNFEAFGQTVKVCKKIP